MKQLIPLWAGGEKQHKKMLQKTISRLDPSDPQKKVTIQKIKKIIKQVKYGLY